ncbi:gamma-glutamyl-gamma-aminobutyrate hydrolase family protein [Terasakiella sp. A23]|uniref:gamma-glutamyl-gamma-aminobutyrate hydrolase family protein n=1 Tax=Terasakiella sp. FCG-A23 TaxID=3080561 RepID=UPI002954FDFC|nr:gamma-glutamyl-gamma-aminobutyrate hydrolase family protein [Terasakiella sp. A23]MDV7338002.1 gamma-glutamyl-gamma-aminobutyrate hydrolase family protein [Terasakiella sp. A23]
MKTPLIGITMDSEDGSAGAYSKFDWYALRENYAGSVAHAGGLPVPLPHEPELAEQYLDLIDGLVITGGAFDVDPSMYGESDVHDTVITKDKRTKFEWAMVQGALDRDMPILGICGGQQLLHVVLGGKLIQHIPDSYDNCLPHEQPNPRDEAGHTVAVKPGTLLHKIVGEDELSINSAHHQAVANEPDGIIINATAPDGVLEGIEVPGKKFCLGVQWHPEFHICEGDKKIFTAFIEAART